MAAALISGIINVDKKDLTVEDIRAFKEFLIAQGSLMRSDYLSELAAKIDARVSRGKDSPEVIEALNALNGSVKLLILTKTTPVQTAAPSPVPVPNDATYAGIEGAQNLLGHTSEIPEPYSFRTLTRLGEGVLVPSSGVPDSVHSALNPKGKVSGDERAYVGLLIKMKEGMGTNEGDTTTMKNLLPSFTKYLENEKAAGNPKVDKNLIDSFKKKVKSGDVEGALNLLQQAGLSSLASPDEVAAASESYKILTGEEIVYVDAGIGFRFNIVDLAKLQGVSTGVRDKWGAIFDIFADFAISGRGHKIKEKKGFDAGEIERELKSIALSTQIGPGFTLTYKGREVARVKLGLEGTVMYMQEMETVDDISPFASGLFRLPVWDFSSGTLYLYSGSRIQPPSLWASKALERQGWSGVSSAGFQVELDKLGSVYAGGFYTEKELSKLTDFRGKAGGELGVTATVIPHLDISLGAVYEEGAKYPGARLRFNVHSW